MHTQHVYIEAQIEHLRIQIHQSSFNNALKEDLLNRLALLEMSKVKTLCDMASQPLTAVKVRYVITFLINMSVRDIATLFSVDTASVYSVRYRLRKMFPPTTVLPF